MKYTSFRYIFPPRPKNPIPNTELTFWDNGSLIAQPKLNGSNCLIFTNGVKHIAMNRHNGRLTNFQLKDEEISKLYKGTGGWTILNGEYLNKNKQDENRKAFNHKFIIFDILVNDGLTPIDLIEGLVLKRKNARLELGTSELNNVKSQIKCRKETKNYKY